MPEGVTRFIQLEVWKRAHGAALEVYRRTEAFPSRERFGLVAQMRSAAVSVPANIAEGSTRRRPRDKAHFYTIARSSADELPYYFILSTDLGFLQEDAARSLDGTMDEVCRMLYAMIESWESRLAR
jgi:four helix bundle protein